MRERTILPLKVATPEKEKKPVVPKKKVTPQESKPKRPVTPQENHHEHHRHYSDVVLSEADYDLIEQLQRDFSLELPPLNVNPFSPAKQKTKISHLESYPAPQIQSSMVPVVLQTYIFSSFILLILVESGWY
jgi:hypothetical protein